MHVSTKEFNRLMDSFVNGNLDTIHNRHPAIVGVGDCFQSLSGLRSYNLVDQICSIDLAGAIARLPMTRKKLILLYYLDAFTLPEIALALEFSSELEARMELIESGNQIIEHCKNAKKE